MRVIGYIESAFWTMRQHEFGAMMRAAYAHAGELDGFLEQSGVIKPQTMMARSGERLAGTRYVEMRGDVAVVDVNGIIAKRMDMFTEICFGGTSTEKLIKDFQTCLDDSKVKAIVFNIDSPGGEAFGINELAQAIYAGRSKKPIHAYVSGLGCSGAYWLASAAKEITIDKSAFVGSIGVVTAWTDDKEFYKLMGIRREVVTSSNAPFKRLDFDNEEHRAELQRELDSLENVFIKAVARNRNVTVEQVKTDFNKGGVLAGADAVKAKMADAVGSLEEVIKSASKQARSTASFGAFNHGEMNMSLTEKIKAFFASDEIKPLLDTSKEYAVIERPASSGEEERDPVAEPTPAEEPEAAPAADPAPDAAPAEEPPPTDVEALHARAVSAEANAFIEAEVSAGRLLPAEKPGFLSLYVQAAADDRTAPLKEGSRVDSLKAAQATRKPHGLTQESVVAETNEIFVLGLGESQKSKMQKDAEAQVDQYVSTVAPKTNLQAVK